MYILQHCSVKCYTDDWNEMKKKWKNLPKYDTCAECNTFTGSYCLFQFLDKPFKYREWFIFCYFFSKNNIFPSINLKAMLLLLAIPYMSSMKCKCSAFSIQYFCFCFMLFHESAIDISCAIYYIYTFCSNSIS